MSFLNGGGKQVVLRDEGIEDLTHFSIEVIRHAGDEALSFYGKGDSAVKFDEELVTEAELHLMGYFQEQLQAHFPEHQVFENNQEAMEYTHEGRIYPKNK